MKAEIKGNELMVSIPVKNPLEVSASGKSMLVASSHGNQPTTVIVEGKPVYVSVNAYIRLPKSA